MPAPDAKLIPLQAIKLHTDLQIRKGTDFATVRRYSREMKSGAVFPPILAAKVGMNIYIIDGHHRYEAAVRAGLGALKAIVRTMTLREAIREAFKSNQDGHPQQP
jgi:hypothetical protein